MAFLTSGDQGGVISFEKSWSQSMSENLQQVGGAMLDGRVLTIISVTGVQERERKVVGLRTMDDPLCPQVE